MSIQRMADTAPSIRVEDGMRQTYEWIHAEMVGASRKVVVSP
jgi:hypothetical protein